MHPDRIAELLAPFLGPSPRGSGHRPEIPRHSEPPSVAEESAVLSSAQLQSISTYIDLLLRWNSRINLTSVRQPEEIVTRHFGESIFAARHLFPSQITRGQPPPVQAGPGSTVRTSSRLHVIDIGSGAGFPGLPIKIWAPHVHLTLIESTQKKATFLREVVRSLTLSNIDVFTGTAVDFSRASPEHRKTASPEVNADIVTFRAVERFQSILPVAVRLIAPGGRLAILVSQTQADSVRTLVPDLNWSEPAKLPLSASRVVIVGSFEPR
jgi:16S rRNA (guanine527-N7)-methyltransferase